LKSNFLTKAFSLIPVGFVSDSSENDGAALDLPWFSTATFSVSGGVDIVLASTFLRTTSDSIKGSKQHRNFIFPSQTDSGETKTLENERETSR
jgi:hypothetical protein